MITKILFTLAVVIVVALVFRHRSHGDKVAQSSEGSSKGANQGKTNRGSLSTRTVAYCILVVLVALSTTIFMVSYKSDNKIINIRVIAEDGMSTIYQAKQKSIKGRRFITLDGKQVTLGESDRIEMTP